MRTIIVEDELNVQKGFVKLLNTFCPEVEIVGIAENISKALSLIEGADFDLLFLDINLPDGSGFDLIHRIPERDFDIIFITAYDQYAVDAFKVCAIDYLLKPISPELLKNAIAKVKSNPVLSTNDRLDILNTKLQGKAAQSEKIILKDAEELQVVSIGDIIYCEAKGGYTKLHFTDKGHFFSSTHLKEYERIFNPYSFVRCHHSYLINLHHVKTIQKSHGGVIIMSNGKNLPLSTRKKPLVMEAMKNVFIN